MADSKTEILFVLQSVIKYLILFQIVTSSIFSKFKKLNFVYYWCFNIVHFSLLFHTPKFSYGSHLDVGLIKIFCFKSLDKWTEGKKHLFLDFVTRNKLKSSCPNSTWKLCWQLIMNWFSKERKGTSFHMTYDVPKRPTVLKKIDFWYFKVKWWWNKPAAQVADADPSPLKLHQ